MKTVIFRMKIVAVLCCGFIFAACETETKESAEPTATALTVKNQSFSDLLNVQWQGIDFRLDTVENAITAGRVVTERVAPGSGYIYFKRKSNPAFARTKEVVTIEKSTTVEFVFLDTT